MNHTPIPIIILNWNGISDTLECLGSVLKMPSPNFIVYLVDNASEDGSQAILSQKYGQHPSVRLIFNQQNLGFTRGNNQILRQILQQEQVPEYIALLNNCLLYTSPSPRDLSTSRMPSSA